MHDTSMIEAIVEECPPKLLFVYGKAKTMYSESDMSLSEEHEILDRPEVAPRIRQSYVDAIQALNPFDKVEAEDIQKTREWLIHSQSLHKPHNMEEHLGVLAILISPNRSHTFLMQHRKAGIWLPPGGHVDIHQTLQEAVRAEVCEELQVQSITMLIDNPVFLTRTLTQGTNAGHIDITFWHALEGNPEDSYIIQEKEASDVMWMSIDELLSRKDMSHLHRGFQKLRNMELTI
jgi:8-oxo-dGTP diphosphatase